MTDTIKIEDILTYVENIWQLFDNTRGTRDEREDCKEYWGVIMDMVEDLTGMDRKDLIAWGVHLLGEKEPCEAAINRYGRAAD